MRRVISSVWGDDRIVRCVAWYVAGVACAGLVKVAQAETLYWPNLTDRTVLLSRVDGSDSRVLITTVDKPYSVAVDRPGGKVYWTCVNAGKIQRANLDGSDVEELVTEGLAWPAGIALDPSAGKMYWTDQALNVIRRANLDGSVVEDVLASGLNKPIGIAVDPRGAGALYWAEFGSGKIRRSDLDGANVVDLAVPTLATPSRLALDLRHDKIYWSTVRIERANLDGSNVEVVVGGGVVLEGVALAIDAGDDKLFWTRNLPSGYQINRCNLDGTGNVVILEGAGKAFGIAVSIQPGDADRDGDVDLADYAVFGECLGGPEIAPTPSGPKLEQCLETFDFDTDGDVDLSDGAALAAAFTG